jgi:hypothetical protein
MSRHHFQQAGDVVNTTSQLLAEKLVLLRQWAANDAIAKVCS